MAAKIPDYYSCEICGVDGLTDGEMRYHIVMCHLKNAVACPFCELTDVTEQEMLDHVNSAHLDYLTPEHEMLAFIDDDDGIRSPLTMRGWEPKSSGFNNINNNNNVGFFNTKADVAINGESSMWGSPQRSQLALNLRPSTASSSQVRSLKCPMCSYTHENPAKLEEHVNRQHFDLTSPSVSADSPPRSYNSCYNCPICVQSFENTPDLELHVNIEHKDILSPAKPCVEVAHHPEKGISVCPICCMNDFSSTDELAVHIEDHFNQKGVSPLTPDLSGDRLLAKEMEKRDKEVQRLREQHEFELLRAQYGMDNEGNFKEQSITNMQRAVYSGELSVADYYERQIELRMAESTGVDDGSSCTRDLVGLIVTLSSSSPNVMRTLLCSTVDHYASTYGDKGWGCGYRNTQMLLSSLFHHTGYNEHLYKLWLVGTQSPVGGSRGELPTRSAMPSISRLQEIIEWAWRQGFDVQGSEQLGGQLVNTRKWIGATEVVTILSSLRIRCELVDFHRPTSASGSHPDLFTWVHNYFQAFDDFKPPLYLQHQGHSRTIIGCEELRDGGISLLLFDPSHSPGQMSELRSTSTAGNVLRTLRKNLPAMKAKQYQIVAVAGIMDSEAEYQNSKVLRSVRIPPDR